MKGGIADYLEKKLKAPKAAKKEAKEFSAVARLAKHLKVDEDKLGELLKDAMDELNG